MPTSPGHNRLRLRCLYYKAHPPRSSPTLLTGSSTSPTSFSQAHSTGLPPHDLQHHSSVQELLSWVVFPLPVGVRHCSIPFGMACRLRSVHVLICFVSVLVLFVSGVRSATFTFSNNCGYAVWPGLLASAGSSPLPSTGFQLERGESKSVSAPAGWSGRFWGRTLCSADSSGKFSCATGDCGSGTVECSGRGAAPPATLAEFTLNGGGGMDFYDVSLVDGYNLPVLVVPQGGGGGGNGTCATTGCLVDLNGLCPSELKVTSSSGDDGVACKSACEAFGKDEYCCSGAHSNPSTCPPTSYSQFFKNACPRAYSYAYDDGTSTFTCPGGVSYHITFCPTTASQKKSGDNTQTVPVGETTTTGDAMIYQGALISSAAASPRAAATPLLFLVAVLVGSLLL